jgi:hypothetical protein
VVVVTGLHQAQRRRAVRELLAATPATVVLHHDLSRAGRGEVVRRIWDNLGTSLETRVPLTNGCPCCALREDLGRGGGKPGRGGLRALACLPARRGVGAVLARAPGRRRCGVGHQVRGPRSAAGIHRTGWKTLQNDFAELLDPVS